MGGTKLECYAIINVMLAAGEKQQEEAVNDYWGCTRQQQGIISFHNFQDFSVHKEEAAVIMDNKQSPITTTSSSNSSIEESIRKTMQMHEDIFQHQVKELHRLYSIQKTIMKEEAMKKKKKQQTGIHLWNQYTTSNWPPPPPHPNRIEEDEVELTLSIGVSNPNINNKPKKRLRNSDHNSSLSIESDRGGGDNSGSTTETSNKADKKRPFWLFQV